MNHRNARLVTLIAAGLAGSLASTANAQPFVVNISGATLLQNFFTAPASTNDYIDVDGDGLAGKFGTLSPDQLAPSITTPGVFPGGSYWVVQYRATGSVNGLKELTLHGQNFVFTNDSDASGITAAAASFAAANRTTYINGASHIAPPYVAANPGGAPYRANTATLAAIYPGAGTDGVRTDIAPLDVPITWAVYGASGTPHASAGPTTAGYGLNPRTAVSTSGAPISQTNALIGLSGLNSNTGSPDANTIYQTQVAAVPFCFMVSYGVGYTQMDASDLQYLYATGRTKSGENLVASGRDIGSGTRNGTMNGIGLDPSYGVGENVGQLNNNAKFDILGPDFLPSNKDGTGAVERVVRNHRLAIGYVGAEKAVSGSSPDSWLTGTNPAADILGIKFDVGNYGGTQYYRPNHTALFHNGQNGYNLIGIETFMTIGDPKNQNEIGGTSGNTNPRMRNPYAAAYINNITASIAAFTAVPGGDNSNFMPGELLANSFILAAATDKIHDLVDPTTMVNNPVKVQAVQDYADQFSIYANALYDSFQSNATGKVGARTALPTGQHYSDGVDAGANYKNVAGAAVSNGSDVKLRNKIAGDFDGNGVRNANDVSEMIKAYRFRWEGAAWTPNNGTGSIAGAPGSDAVPEILGDFTGDGNFDKQDIRYWADGLHLVAGKLDRKAGFTAVDNAYAAQTGNNNFFGTTIGTGNPYTPGASRADVAGPSGFTTPGYNPIGADGVVDINDLRYIRKQFACNLILGGAAADWNAGLDAAASFDLSCDLNGDLKVDADDVAEFYAIIGSCAADYNCDGFVDIYDFTDFVSGFETGDCLADFNNDGFIDIYDFTDFVTLFESGC